MEPLNILLVDDDLHMLMTLSDILVMAGYRTTLANSADAALALTDHFDCVITDVKMTQRNGLEFFYEFSARSPNVPVLLMTAYAESLLVQDALHEGVIAVLDKPLEIPLLLDFLEFLAASCYVAIVDEAPAFSASIDRCLGLPGEKVVETPNSFKAENVLPEQTGVVLLDLRLPKETGVEVLKKLHSTYRHVPVILLTGYAGEEKIEIEQAAYHLNVYACLHKPFHLESLVSLLRKAHVELLRKAYDAEKGGPENG